jgi:hypothetical protein
MTVDEIRETLYVAARLRMPRRDADATLTWNIEQVEDYLIQTAVTRGELEEARLHAKDALDELADQWLLLDPAGYEPHLPTGVRTTQAAVERAKALAEPDLAASVKQCRRLIDRLSDQIKRLELDDKAASRRYSMMTGS